MKQWGQKSDFWTDERVRFLRDNWPTMFASEIARELGSNCTRNAVIGKANRLGLKKPPKEKKPEKPQVARTRLLHKLNEPRQPKPFSKQAVKTPGSGTRTRNLDGRLKLKYIYPEDTFTVQGLDDALEEVSW